MSHPIASRSPGFSACSGCAGDYEDPERTASSEVDEEDDTKKLNADDAPRSVPRERVPVHQK
jgi:hypothetical protein